MINYRRYKDGDEKLIIRLYKEVFNKDLSIQLWQWKYNRFPKGKKYIFLAFDKSRCIGQYALIDFELNAFGKTIPALLSLDSMIHPHYQGQNIFTKLVEYAKKNTKSQQYPSITFLNENSISVYTKKFNWKYLGNIPVYCSPLSLIQLRNTNKILYFLIKPFSLTLNYISSTTKGISLHRIKSFDEVIEHKCNKNNRFYSISRNKEFLDWRYLKSPKDYQCFNIIYKMDLIGYCVIKVEEKFGLQFTWIMDLFVDEEYVNYFDNVLNAIADKYFLKSDFITSLLPNEYYKKYYAKSVFFKIPQFLFPHEFYFCASKNHSNKTNIFKLENWYMTWSLNDVI